MKKFKWFLVVMAALVVTSWVAAPLWVFWVALGVFVVLLVGWGLVLLVEFVAFVTQTDA